MIIAITGASGFIASSVRKMMKTEGAEYIPLKRDEPDEIWEYKLMKAQVVINLAGAPVIQRWTKKNKAHILNSRVHTTKRLVTILNRIQNAPELMISASAIGIYPDKGNEIMTESSLQTGDSFLSEVVKKWELAASELSNSAVRLVIARIGVVIGKDGGLLKKTLPLFILGLGGKIASSKQALSFIHIEDIVRAFQFFIENRNTNGIFNLAAPNITTNAEFTRALAKAVKRPAFFTVPAFALKLLYGKAAQIMINGEKVYPKRLLEEGFEFKYATIESALNE